MTKHEAFRRQAASDLRLLHLLLRQSTDDVPQCHRLHYLQMAAEKAGKAVVFALGGQVSQEGYSHSFVGPLLNVLKRATISRALGYPPEKYRAYVEHLNSLRPFLAHVERLHPRSGRDPNVEYPWEGPSAEGGMVWHVPAEWAFAVHASPGQWDRAVRFIRVLIDRLDELARLATGARADEAR
jgi:hypothetical protein